MPRLPVPFRVIASGRLASEKDQITLIKAVSMSRHAGDIQLVIAGTGPLKQYLKFRAGRLLARKARYRIPQARRYARFVAFGRFVRALFDCRHRIGERDRGDGVRIGAGDRRVRTVGGQPVRADRRVVVPRAGRGPAGRRIDWWIAHQAERAEWGEKYAEYTKAHYSVEASVHKFVDMERKAIGE